MLWWNFSVLFVLFSNLIYRFEIGCYCADYFRSLQMTLNFHVVILQFCVELDLCNTSYSFLLVFFLITINNFHCFWKVAPLCSCERKRVILYSINPSGRTYLKFTSYTEQKWIRNPKLSILELYIALSNFNFLIFEKCTRIFVNSKTPFN